MARNRFQDPSTGETYDWQVNHDAEQPLAKQRNIARTAPTGNVGLVKQQGDDGPLLLNLSGEILHRHQYQQMWHWFELCRDHTIYFTDFDGAEYEVQITDFQPTRVRTLNNHSDPTMPFNYFTYTIQMEIYRVISGDLLGVTP